MIFQQHRLVTLKYIMDYIGDHGVKHTHVSDTVYVIRGTGYSSQGEPKKTHKLHRHTLPLFLFFCLKLERQSKAAVIFTSLF